MTSQTWLQQFLALRSKPTISLDEIQQSQLLKAENLPERLFKFRGPDSRSVETLRQECVWLSAADRYNDPYECYTSLDYQELMRFHSGRRFDEIIHRLRVSDLLSAEDVSEARRAEDPFAIITDRVLAKHAPELTEERRRKMYKELVDASNSVNADYHRNLQDSVQHKTKICSFSERVDSIVMWGHYAENHSGYAVEYSPKEWMRLNDALTLSLHPVIYDGDIFDATKYIVQHVTTGDFNNLYGILAAMRKAKDWEYEREWRFIVPMGNDSNGWLWQIGKPSAIYLGTRTSEEVERNIREYAESREVPVYKMILSVKRFKLEPQPLTQS